MNRFSSLLLLGCALALVAGPAAAQTPYSLAWPDSDPIWEMDVLPPSLSSGPNGGGVEIRNVTYNGRLVMKRGHVPILNVKYESGCNCFRDWQDSEVVFVADNPITSWIAESTPGTVQTMCDAAPTNCTDTNGDGSADSCNDVGSFTGVAVERFEDKLVLTTHMRAGWYRYTMRWQFFADGTIRPLFGFTSTGSACTQNARWHHAYWRFDFDIDGADNDYVVETSNLAPDAFPSTVGRVIGSEETMTWKNPVDELAWRVIDTEANIGYQITPSAEDYLTPTDPMTGIPAIDDFAREDVVVARYAPGELDDGFGSCSAQFDSGSSSVVNGQSTFDTDVVFWYRSGTTKPDIDPGTCYTSGPVLTPLGDWSADVRSVASEDGAAPTGFYLADPYPNPFDGTTTVRFSVERAQDVSITLYDGVGREVKTVFTGSVAADTEQTLSVSGADLPSGVYTLRLEGDDFSTSKRIALVK